MEKKKSDLPGWTPNLPLNFHERMHAYVQEKIGHRVKRAIEKGKIKTYTVRFIPPVKFPVLPGDPKAVEYHEKEDGTLERIEDRFKELKERALKGDKEARITLLKYGVDWLKEDWAIALIKELQQEIRNSPPKQRKDSRKILNDIFQAYIPKMRGKRGNIISDHLELIAYYLSREFLWYKIRLDLEVLTKKDNIGNLDSPVSHMLISKYKDFGITNDNIRELASYSPEAMAEMDTKRKFGLKSFTTVKEVISRYL